MYTYYEPLDEIFKFEKNSKKSLQFLQTISFSNFQSRLSLKVLGIAF